ncbi:MAG: NADP-reducing hydrogenase subunit HndA [Candidatus Scalindua arabica]|uniref:NADP-reducing hydrogenase subunit HndA n=1 Tax=Candidatus Scalindua arabica TaxID=1127984 RepID=A0A941W4I8_9BACT|nr:NADP-reducing hydrogenase subunit HndA [Candidatus Scalindua arabica]
MKKEATNRLAVDIRPTRKIVSSFGDVQESNLISILQELQDEYGYLPKAALKEVSRLMDVPLTRVFGIVTFYSQFSLVPKGKFTIKVCIGTACHVRGAEEVKTTIKQLLDVKEGETSADYMFTLESVACLGVCALGPVMVVGSSKKAAGCCDGQDGQTPPSGDKSYGHVKTEKIEGILESYSSDKE